MDLRGGLLRLLAAGWLMAFSFGSGLWLEFLPHDHLSLGAEADLLQTHGHGRFGQPPASCDPLGGEVLSLSRLQGGASAAWPLLPPGDAELPGSPPAVAATELIPAGPPEEAALVPPSPPPRGA